MPYALLKEVEKEIPAHIGVYCGEVNQRRAKKQPLGIDEKILWSSMIRSLSREFDFYYKSQDEAKMRQYKRQIKNLEQDKAAYHRQYIELYAELLPEEKKRIRDKWREE